jgi:DnaA family protein
MNHQLSLAIQLNDEATFSDFVWGENTLLQTHIQQALTGQGEPLIYLWGLTGCGKSHLLQACCQHVGRHQLPAIYLPLNTLKEWGPEVIDGLDGQALLCVDEVDAIASHPEWEEALFHLYNRIRDQGKTILILAGGHSPRQTPIELPDLRSRLSGGLVIQLHELNDDAKVETLRSQAKKRGLELPTPVAQFLVSRCARNMHDLHALLNRLDQASWVAQRKLTIPFIKAILDI